MASRFWVGGGSSTSWAATGNTNWATSSGGANNASVPGTGDVAIFDSNSGTGNSVIGANITIQNLDCNGYTGTLTHNTGVTLTLNSSGTPGLRFGSGMTYTPASTSSIIAFTLTSGTATVTCNGKSMAAMTINGAGGTVQLVDTLLVNAVQNAILTLTAGTLDASTNTAAITCSLLSCANSNTRSLILGGTVTIGGNITNNKTIWDFSTATGLTFTKNSANVVILAPTSAIDNSSFATGALAFNNVTLNNTTTPCSLNFFNATQTLANLTVGYGWNLTAGNANTITIASGGALTFNGTKTRPNLIFGVYNGNIILSVPSGSVSLQWGGLLNVIGTGGATFSATDAFDFGNNSGWSISPPADSALTPAGIATAVWQDTTAGDLNVAGSIAQQLWTGAQGSSTGVRGTVTTGASTTSIPTSAFTLNGSTASGVVANQFAGRTVLFDTNTATAGLRGAIGAISASSASNTPTFTVGTLPATPASGDAFSVI